MMNFREFKDKYQKEEVRDFPHKAHPLPVVSVLVQTYQHENYIRTCLDSILEQVTDFPFEILLGEDASKDNTRNICIEYAEKYPGKIRLFLHHPENKIKVLGITTGNFNALYNFFSAKGEFIAFCEGDDFWADPLKLQNQFDYLKSNSNYVLAYHSFKEVNENNQSLPKELTLNQPAGDISAEDLKKLIYHPLLSTIIFRNLLRDKIPKEMVDVINVDSFLISLLGNFGAAGFLENIKPTFYRRHQGGMWSGKEKSLKFKLKLHTYSKLIKYYFSYKKMKMAGVFALKYGQMIQQLFHYYLKKLAKIIRP